MFESWIMDFRYAVRRLLARPTYAALAVLTLALGAGGTAAIFSVVRTILIEPLPIAREGEVGVLWFGGSWTEEEFLHFRPNFPGFQKMASWRPNDSTLELPNAPLRLVPAIAASSELFDVLEARPQLGRTFRAGDDVLGAELVVVLSHALWTELGSRPDIVGSRLQIGGLPRTVVGVMPRGFWFPAPTTRMWTAAPLNPQSRSGNYFLIGRVASGHSLANMQAPLQTFTTALGQRFQYRPQWDKTKNPTVTPAREYFVGDVQPSLIATLAAMGVILFLACANVAALMLGQVDARATEMAVRAALGANRLRLVQQLVLESLVIGVLAGAVGAALAVAGFEILVHSLPLGALAENATLNWTLFWAAMAAALLASALVAVLPGIALWRGSTLKSTMATTRTGGISGRGGRLEGGLVIGQMALAVLLATGAGLLMRSVANLRAIDAGVRTDAAVIVDATMPIRQTVEERRRTILQMVTALESLHGVKAVGATQKLPLRGSGHNWGLGIRGQADLRATTATRTVSRDYFTALGMPIVKGRGFEPGDRQGSERVVVINEALAAKFFPGEDPIGRIVTTFGDQDQGERIIGVVGSALEADLTDGAVPARYMLYDQMPGLIWHQVSFVLRTDSTAGVPALMDAARSTIGREGTQLAVQKTTTLQEVFDLAMGPTGQIVTLLAILAGLALVLGAVGVYGVISHYVVRRSRDYAVCIALGQSPGRVVRQVVGRGAALVAVGSALGIAAALASTQVLSTLLYGVERTDPLAMLGAVAVLLGVGVIAAYVPARRASLTDPATVLRQS